MNSYIEMAPPFAAAVEVFTKVLKDFFETGVCVVKDSLGNECDESPMVVPACTVRRMLRMTAKEHGIAEIVAQDKTVHWRGKEARRWVDLVVPNTKKCAAVHCKLALIAKEVSGARHAAHNFGDGIWVNQNQKSNRIYTFKGNEAVEHFYFWLEARRTDPVQLPRNPNRV